MCTGLQDGQFHHRLNIKILGTSHSWAGPNAQHREVALIEISGSTFRKPLVDDEIEWIMPHHAFANAMHEIDNIDQNQIRGLPL